MLQLPVNCSGNEHTAVNARQQFCLLNQDQVIERACIGDDDHRRVSSFTVSEASSCVLFARNRAVIFALAVQIFQAVFQRHSMLFEEAVQFIASGEP